MEEHLEKTENQTQTDAEDLTERKRVIEAVLFTLGRAADLSELAKACDCDRRTARQAAEELRRAYEAKDGALQIRYLNGSYQMCTNRRYYPALIRLVSKPKKPVLTDVVMETLSIIAYRMPVTKVEIEKIRGVKSDHAVNKLIEFGLVEEVGRLDAPGRPALFAPTEEFYRRFGISTKAELPRLGAEAQSMIEEEVREEVKASFGENVSEQEIEAEEEKMEVAENVYSTPSSAAHDADMDGEVKENETESLVLPPKESSK